MKSNIKSKAFTLLETLIAILVFGIVAGALYGILTRASSTQAFANAKAAAKDQAEIIIRTLERDISSAVTEFNTVNATYSCSFKATTGGWEMNIPEKSTPNAVKKVEYLFDAAQKSLSRKVSGPDGGTRLLSDKVEELKMAMVSASSVLIELKIGVVPDGSKIVQIHDQKMSVTIQSAVQSNLDRRWKDPKEVINNY
ncbi:prepilin-type N-terminal cleavage/methylation domain-containing protein [bacterium]|nr:prepilin-type N-terminal cleavage/methylation domain-containing protein [bacterium]